MLATVPSESMARVESRVLEEVAAFGQQLIQQPAAFAIRSRSVSRPGISSHVEWSPDDRWKVALVSVDDTRGVFVDNIETGLRSRLDLGTLSSADVVDIAWLD
eukprot:1693910-Rhodomonas_salina.1